MVRPRDLGHRASRRTGLPYRIQSIAQPGVARPMSDPVAPIVIAPGRVNLDQLGEVLAGASVALDPSFWPGVGAAAAIVARAASACEPVYGINTGFGKLASKRIPVDQTVLLQ